MTLPDNRIQLPPTKIDFDTQVGVTGQVHDDYPSPQGQARFDHMRIYLIGLLSQQSSFDPPSQKRDGTPWFDLNELSLKISLNNVWLPYSDAIKIGGMSLSDWYTNVETALVGIAPEIFFSGVCTQQGVVDIPIPTEYQVLISAESKAFVTINRTHQFTPLEVQFIGSPNPTTIRLLNAELEADDTFAVSIRRIPNSNFLNSTLSIP
jgi:hypothetical protein